MNDSQTLFLKRFAAVITSLREGKKMSRHALAVKAGISPWTLAHIERRGNTRLQTAERGANALGITLKDLIKAVEKTK